MEDIREPLARLTVDLRGSLGGAFVGMFLFGSHASGRPTAASDIDVALIVADAGALEANRVAQETLSRSILRGEPVSLSVETYSRFKYLLESGDPFAWVICLEGVVLSDPSGLLVALKSQAIDGEIPVARERVLTHLEQKAREHGQKAVERLYDALCEAQLASMAAAQHAALAALPSLVHHMDVVCSSSWPWLEEHIPPGTDPESLRTLSVAHKRARIHDHTYPGRELVAMLEKIGVWSPSSVPKPSAEEQS